MSYGKIYSEASLGLIKLNTKEIKYGEFENKIAKVSVPLTVDTGYSNVKIKLYIYQDPTAKIESVNFEKHE